MKELKAWVPTWEDVRDQEVRKTELETAIELRHLVETQKLKQDRRELVTRQLEDFGESESRVRAHKTQARVWCALAIAMVLVTAVGIWLGTGFFVDALGERLAITVTLAVISVVGGTVLLSALSQQIREERLRIIFICAASLVIVCAILGAVTLGIGRMLGNTATAIQQQELLRGSGDLAENVATPSVVARRLQQAADALGKLSVFWAILVAVGGELGTLLTTHLWLQHSKVVRTLEPVLAEFRKLGEELAANARRQEEVRHWPELRYIELTLAGYREEQTRALALEADRARLEAQRTEEARHFAKRASLGYALKWTFIGFATLLVLVLGAAWAYAGTGEVRTASMVIILDLSSSAANAEFARNVQAVESLIRQAPAGGTRLVILGVTEVSFGTASLLTLTSPSAPGRLGEYQASWQANAVKQWRKVAGTLAPHAKGSDLFGALARAALEFAEAPQGPKHLIILSDMRQVGRGFNFERPVGDPIKVSEDIHRRGLIPRLGGVEVWALGVQTSGTDERQWARLRTVWSEYIRRAGAELRAFSPNRRLASQ